MAEIFKKTWKRETAWAMLVWLFGSISWIAWNDPTTGADLVKATIAPVLVFAGGVFGLHVYQNKVANDNITYKRETSTVVREPDEFGDGND